MKTALLDGKFAPITSTIGLLGVPVAVAVNAYREWMGPILAKLDNRLEQESVEGPLDEGLRRLLPRTSPVQTRFLFAPTRSAYTAYFDNARLGTDASTPMKVLAGRLGCEALRVTAVEHTMPTRITRDTKGKFGATIFELFGVDGKPRRTVYVANDGGKWKFGQSGTPLDFEQTELYESNPIRQRFTPEMLGKYLLDLGLKPFEAEWYTVDGASALLLSRTGPLPPTMAEYGLEL